MRHVGTSGLAVASARATAIALMERKLVDVEAPEAPPAKNVGLLPVRVVDSQRGRRIQIILPDGHILHVGRGFDEDTFAQVLEVLTGR